MLLVIAPRSPSLTGKQLVIEDFHAEVIVMPDSSVDVTETIHPHFYGAGWHGLYRTIPVEYVTPQGFNYSLFLSIKSITDDSGRALKYESSRERHYRKFKIYIPNPDNSVQTVNIRYTVSDALRFFEDHDEFYWNVTGDEWTVPIQSASAHIVLPESTSHIRANTFTGSYGSRAHDASVEVAANAVEVRSTEPLQIRQGLTVAVAFDKGTVHEPTAADKVILFLRSNWPLIIPVLTFLLMYYLWWTRGRDPRLAPDRHTVRAA